MRLAVQVFVLALTASSALRVPILAPKRCNMAVPPSQRGGTPMLAAALEESILETTSSSPVVIYSKSWCPYCAQCKELFDGMSQPYTVIELDQREDGDQLQASLLQMTQQRTVPNVFINGIHLGGNDDTQQAARSGKLTELLKTPMAGRVVPTGGSAGGASAAQLRAVADNKMITETESTVRKVAGVGIGVVTAALYATSGMAYTALASGIFGSICVYRTGAAYQ